MTVLLPLLCLMFSLTTQDNSVFLSNYDLKATDIPLEEFLSANRYINGKSLQMGWSLNPLDRNGKGKIIVKADLRKKLFNNDLLKKEVVISPGVKKRLLVNNPATISRNQASITQQLIDDEEISSGFGKRTDPLNNSRKFHKGIDISRPTGTEVFAWADGVVARSGWQRGYGLTVDIVHPNGIKTRYAHLNLANIQKGQKISKGQILGRVGQTGRTTGANLHFEVIVAGKLADPLNHLSEDGEIVGHGPTAMNNS